MAQAGTIQSSLGLIPKNIAPEIKQCNAWERGVTVACGLLPKWENDQFVVPQKLPTEGAGSHKRAIISPSRRTATTPLNFSCYI